jgi:hypothetical protein
MAVNKICYYRGLKEYIQIARMPKIKNYTAGTNTDRNILKILIVGEKESCSYKSSAID